MCAGADDTRSRIVKLIEFTRPLAKNLRVAVDSKHLASLRKIDAFQSCMTLAACGNTSVLSTSCSK